MAKRPTAPAEHFPEQANKHVTSKAPTTTIIAEKLFRSINYDLQCEISFWPWAAATCCLFFWLESVFSKTHCVFTICTCGARLAGINRVLKKRIVSLHLVFPLSVFSERRIERVCVCVCVHAASVQEKPLRQLCMDSIPFWCERIYICIILLLHKVFCLFICRFAVILYYFAPNHLCLRFFTI